MIYNMFNVQVFVNGTEEFNESGSRYVLFLYLFARRDLPHYPSEWTSLFAQRTIPMMMVCQITQRLLGMDPNSEDSTGWFG